MSLYLYPHGGSDNHGCEAIVRSTIKMMPKEHIQLFSKHPEQDYKYGLNKICEIHKERKPISHYSLPYLKAFFNYRFLKKNSAFEILSLSPLLGRIKKNDILLSIGGDNYCYGTPSYIYLVNNYCRNKGIRTVLWGCSIDEEAINQDMISDLKNYSHIIARESYTYSMLKNKGIAQVSLCPDPAFNLNYKQTRLPSIFKPNNTVGINISPLISTYEGVKGLTMLNYLSLISYIIQNTNMQVALIPHVVWKNNDDRKPLSELFNHFKDTKRVVLVNNSNAEELKWVISQCRFMVAARTHASIAAYSSQIPTIVVGYSTKAKGIAKDIFGDNNNYIIPVQSLKNKHHITNLFIDLMDNEKMILEYYKKNMPTYISRTWKAADLLKEI